MPVDSTGFHLNPEESSVIQLKYSILYIVWYRVIIYFRLSKYKLISFQLNKQY